jgi:heptosyltransferase-1
VRNLWSAWIQDCCTLLQPLGVPLVAIFTGSRPGLTGPVGSGPITILGSDGAPPAVDAVIEAVAKVVR